MVHTSLMMASSLLSSPRKCWDVCGNSFDILAVLPDANAGTVLLKMSDAKKLGELSSPEPIEIWLSQTSYTTQNINLRGVGWSVLSKLISSSLAKLPQWFFLRSVENIHPLRVK